MTKPHRRKRPKKDLASAAEPLGSAASGRSDDSNRWWEWLLPLALGVWFVYVVYEDIALDLQGKSGYGFVGFVDSYSSVAYPSRHHCRLEVWLPQKRQTGEPSKPQTPELLRDATEATMTVRAEPEQCRGYRHTWRRFRYRDDDLETVRFAEDVGIVGKSVAAVCLFALLYGLRQAFRWLRRRRRRT